MDSHPHSTRLSLTLAPQHAEKLRRLAEQANMEEGMLARTLLSRAIDEADVDGRSMADLLNGIPGALQRARLGREQARASDTISLDELQ